MVGQALTALEEMIGRSQAEVERLGNLVPEGVNEATLAARQAEVEAARRMRDEALRHLGALQSQLAQAEAAEQEVVRLEAELGTLGQEAMLYDELAEAFGRRGVQAMLIEAAIPEIEREANLFLARLTGGRMAVSLETQRARKSREGAIETLDILVSDEEGVRPYETFSGGEAFRISIALRLALAKLLAHRAGATVRTLVIDEGFGSQDAEGRDRVLEVIRAVQEDYDLVIVVTHIEELKEAFPARLEVAGGQVRVE